METQDNNFNFLIGQLNLRLNMSRKYFNTASTPSFDKFLCPTPSFTGMDDNPVFSLAVVEQGVTARTGSCIEQNPTWELYSPSPDQFTFFFKEYNRDMLTLSVDKKFREGKLQAGDWQSPGKPITLMEIIDVRLFLNWLANYGDLVLHASGFVYEGKGYCFLGESGRGKSTLVRDIAETPGVTILGEDQVILRYLDGQFRIFGTPWHTNPRFCSPLEAPLAKMFFLDRGKPGTIFEMEPMEVSSRILQTAFVPWYRRECLPLILERVGLLAASTRCLGLSYRLGQDGLETLLDA